MLYYTRFTLIAEMRVMWNFLFSDFIREYGVCRRVQDVFILVSLVKVVYLGPLNYRKHVITCDRIFPVQCRPCQTCFCVCDRLWVWFFLCLFLFVYHCGEKLFVQCFTKNGSQDYVCLGSIDSTLYRDDVMNR